MPLQKLLLKPGVNKENTRYTNEGGWYDCDKIRFRQGTPEKIGGWSQISSYTYVGTCRSLWSWASLSGIVYVGVGTYLKFYVEQGGAYNDITPIRSYVTLSGPFVAIAPQTFTVTIANPAVLTASSLATITNGMAFTFTTTGSLPTGLTTGVTYYAVSSSTNTCRLALTVGGTAITTTGTQSGTHTLTSTTLTVTSSTHGAATGDYVNFLGAVALSTQAFTGVTLINVVITGIAGQFSCTASVLAVGQPVTISGIFAGTGSITGYVSPTTYFIIATNGSTTFTLSATSGGPAITTTAGTPTGLTYRVTTNFTLFSALAQNTPVVLTISTGGALPTGLLTGVQYYINVVSGTTVNFTNVPNGAAISTSTVGSGTFSLYVNNGVTAEVLNSSFAVTVVNANSFTIDTSVAAGVYDTGNGGTVNAYYEIPIGYDSSQPLTGWGAGAWDSGSWGTGQSSVAPARIWYQNNFGQDLIYGYRGGPLYYWNASIGTQLKAFTITIAVPGVVTLSSGSLTDGTAVVLESTGTLPTGLTIGTTYYTGGASGATVRLATTYANALASTFITTTGSQTGTHYILPNGIPVTSLGGASDVPALANFVMVSDASRFTICFGCSIYADPNTKIDPMLIRWSDQESVTNWTPAVTNQAGFIRLSHGSQILTAVQTRQEIVVFTDTSLYSMQYLGAPFIWGTQLLGDNISLAGYNTAVIASGVIYWMGVDKFYKYDGRTQTLRCDLLRFIYGDINLDQQAQFFAGTSEGFNEVWWFYCSSGSTTIDSYVTYNYGEDVWAYGTMARTAWLDSGLITNPIAATYSYNLVYHEYGVDDNTTGTALPIEAYVTSSEFDIGDGHNFGFIWRLIPDLTFRGSSTTGTTPQVTFYMLPMQNSGSGYNDPVESGNQSVGGTSYANVSRVGTYEVDQFTGQVYTRVRGRQMSIKISSNQVGTQWQLGAPRIDIRPDGRR